MQRHLFPLLISLGVMAVGPVSGYAHTDSSSGFMTDVFDSWAIKPNAGLDIGARQLSWEENNGDFHFKKHYPSGNIYLGTLVNKYFGFELGYEKMISRQRLSYYEDTMAVLGYTREVGSGAPQSYISEATLRGPNFGLTGFIPFFPSCFPNTAIFGTVGAAWLKLNLTTMMIQDGNAANRPVRWESGHHGVFRFNVGVRQMFAENFGTRVFYQWENTSKLETITPVDSSVGFNGTSTPVLPSDYFTANPKNTHMLGIGLFYQMA